MDQHEQMRHAFFLLRFHGLAYATAPHFSSCAMKERSGQEGRRHEAEAVTAGDADGGKRDAADPATGGIPTEPGDAGGGMHGDGLAPDGNLAIAERGEDAARRPPPRAGEVAAAFPAP